ncbi:MAG: phosphoribosylformylglycinamidine synthase subunit PurS [SAR202 cluster bacterium]|nr:MAG: phosphoribosylformylglycinamidine synthase subunit PurS [SAR202 cluster bacterium]KAA1299199.1 MAG: phosphoribosylformylglycinamidine synthase subunit PurS [SAR202 cluster bacterium]
MIYKFEVKILYKDNVNDPQGLTISESANRIGFENVKSIRSGKIFILEIESDNEKNAKNVTEEISDKLLSNPIIEKFSFNII